MRFPTLTVLQQGWKFLWREKDFYGAGLPRYAGNEAPFFQRQYHLMHSRRSDMEIILHIALGGRTAVQLGIGVDEGEVLPLFLGPIGGHCLQGKLWKTFYTLSPVLYGCLIGVIGN